jgi:hypothetical protein
MFQFFNEALEAFNFLLGAIGYQNKCLQAGEKYHFC